MRKIASPLSWMMFVDGENLTIRGQEFAKASDISLEAGQYFTRDTMVWIPGQYAIHRLGWRWREIEDNAIRSYYYTSVFGDYPQIRQAREGLRALGFDPQVFKKKRKEDKAKGVDIALTKDMLSHAFMGHYDVAVLVAGDGDYLPLVEEVKRLGKCVIVCFFKQPGFSDDLRIAADFYFDLSEQFEKSWRSYLTQRDAGSQQ